MSTISKKKVLVCTNYRSNPNYPSCADRGSEELLKILSNRALAIDIESSPCMGLCQLGPNVRFVPSGNCFNGVISSSKVEELVEEIKAFIAC